MVCLQTHGRRYPCAKCTHAGNHLILQLGKDKRAMARPTDVGQSPSPSLCSKTETRRRPPEAQTNRQAQRGETQQPYRPNPRKPGALDNG
eukprot:6447256-Lingulodinium_polyedra.AAC.1